MSEEFNPHREALNAVNLGLIPVPLAPQSKRPLGARWQDLKPEGVEEAFERASDSMESRGDDRPLNIGLVLGHDGLVDIDLDHPRAIQLAGRILPRTAMRHGRPDNPGSHLWYRCPDLTDETVRRYRMPSGETLIEFRALGGQTMIPPSIHPNGNRLTWEGEAYGGTEGPAVIPAQGDFSGVSQLQVKVALVALVASLAECWPREGGRHDAYLALAGGLLRDADETGMPRPHPFWDRQIEGIIGLLAESTRDADGAGVRIAEAVHTTRRRLSQGRKAHGWPALAGMVGEQWVESIRSIVKEIEDLTGQVRSKPTVSAEADTTSTVSTTTPLDTPADRADEIEDDGWGSLTTEPEPVTPKEPERGTWAMVTRHDEWLDADGNLVNPVLPGVIHREDGLGVVYPGRVNMIYGPSGSGKTLVALQACLDEIRAGGRALMLDLENGYDEIHERLVALGAPLGQRTGGWGYIEAEEPISALQRDSWGQEHTTETGRRNRERFLESMDEFQPTLILLDGTTTLFTTHGLDPNKATGVDTVTSWLRGLCAHGSRTVIILDHTNKNPSVGDGPTGSQHKKSMVQGTMLQVHGESPIMGKVTHSALFATKDRPGKVLKDSHFDAHLGEYRCADIVFEGRSDGSLRVSLAVPDPEAIILDTVDSKPKPGRPAKSDPAQDIQKIMDCFIARTPGVTLTRQEVEGQVHIDSPARTRAAIKTLLEQGRLEQIGGGRSTSYAWTGL